MNPNTPTFDSFQHKKIMQMLKSSSNSNIDDNPRSNTCSCIDYLSFELAKGSLEVHHQQTQDRDRDSRWVCKQCAGVNTGGLLTCDACGASKLHSATGTCWTCSRCSLKNPSSAPTCDACNATAVIPEYLHKGTKMCDTKSKHKQRNKSHKCSAENRIKNNKESGNRNTQKESTENCKEVFGESSSTSNPNRNLSPQCIPWCCPLCTFQNQKTTVVCSMCKNFRTNTSDPLAEQPTQLSQAEIVDHLYNYIVSQCAVKKQLFTDDTFPATPTSLYYSPEDSDNNQQIIKWRRLRSSTVDAVDKHLSWTLFRSIVRPTDVFQGELGDCWFLSSIAVLAEKPDLIRALFVTDRLCSHGVYQIRLCKDGNWMSTIVDDLVPCDTKGNLLYSQAVLKQLYVPLLEKAMAKIHGCYEALTNGNIVEGFATLTGAPCERIDFLPPSHPSYQLEADLLWTRLISSREASFLMGTSSCVANIKEAEYEQMGLCIDHIYSILDVREILRNRLIKLRDPYGWESWTGDWSYDSFNWTPYLRGELLPNGPENGVFWISFADFLRYFSSLGICKVRTGWSEVRFSGKFPPVGLGEEISCYLLTIDEPTELNFVLYQEGQRCVEKSKRSLLDLSLMIAKEATHSTDIYKLVGSSRRQITGFVEYYKMLEPGKYIVIPMALNHCHKKPEDANAYPQYVVAMHSSKKIRVEQITSPPEALADLIISLAVRDGDVVQISENAALYYVKDYFSGFIVMVENRYRNKWVHVICECKDVVNMMTTQRALKTVDLVPPLHRQVIMVVTQLQADRAFSVSLEVDYELVELPGGITRVSEENKQNGLHSPRLII